MEAITYLSALTTFLRLLTERDEEFCKKEDIHYGAFSEKRRATFSVMEGKKYDRIVRTSWGSRSAYAFIDRNTGAIIKCASWNKPEPKKYERGNIYAENPLNGTERFGVVYIK